MRARSGKKPASNARAPTKQRAINKALAEARKNFQSGYAGRADAIVQQILAADPLLLDAMHLKAAILIARNGLPEAAQVLRNVVRLSPGHVAARTDLGDVLRRLNQLTDAEGHLLDVLKLKPRMAGAWLNLGNVYLAGNRLAEAEKAYRSALKFGPGMSEAAANLSQIQLILGRPGDAAASARKAIKLDARHAPHHSKLGLALDRLGDEVAAMAAHDHAVELAPTAVPIKLERARSLAQFGHMDDAISAYRNILAENPGTVPALTHIARLKKFMSVDDSDIAALRAIANRKGLADETARAVNFALGKALEDCGQYDVAYGCFATANIAARRGIKYQRSGGQKLFGDIEAAYNDSGATRGGGGPAEYAPIFIVGMPRSGTSLTEQIIARHPDVHGAGELAAMHDCLSELLARTDTGTHVDAMRTATSGDFARLAEIYLKATRDLAPAGLRIADKAPSNFIYIGLIKRMFPEASIVHCRREAADNALSIYKTNFVAGHMPYAFEVDDIADRFALYHRLMEHWQQVMPDAFMTSDYEALVADQAAQSRRLLDWCGLDWHEDVLDFHTSTTPVHTASIAQVRQPVHSGSVGLATRYGSAAQPLITALTKAGVA